MLTFKEKLLCKIMSHLKYDSGEFVKCKWNDVIIRISRMIEPDFNNIMILVDKLTVGDEVRIPTKFK